MIEDAQNKIEKDKERKLDILKNDLGIHTEIATSNTKWLVSSFLLLNGGALVALLRIDQFRSSGLESWAWMFLCGMGAALMGAMLLTAGHALAGLRLMAALWDGSILEKRTFKEVDEALKTPYLFLVPASILIAASGLLFIIGCLTVHKTSMPQSDQSVTTIPEPADRQRPARAR